MNQSDSIAAIATALVGFQAACEGAKKNAMNPAFKNKYADLSAVWEAIHEPMAANGLAVVQLPLPAERGELRLRTQLLHTSGEWIASEIVMPLGKVDPQGYGSALTYARRYALAAMLGVTQEDDDGNGAMKGQASAGNTSSAPATRQATPAPRGNGALSEAQIKRMFGIARTEGVDNQGVKNLMFDNFSVDSTDALTRAQYDSLCDKLIPAANPERRSGGEPDWDAEPLYDESPI